MKYWPSLLLLVSSLSFATEYSATGNVNTIKMVDLSLGANADWIGIDGFGSAGTCGTNVGYVAIRFSSSTLIV